MLGLLLDGSKGIEDADVSKGASKCQPLDRERTNLADPRKNRAEAGRNSAQVRKNLKDARRGEVMSDRLQRGSDRGVIERVLPASTRGSVEGPSA